MTQDDRMETITDPAEIRATDDPDERGDFPCCTTPAPVGTAVALDLDATVGEVARLRRNLTATAQDATDAKCARDAARREADQLRHLLGSHADGHRCTCTMTDPGVYHGNNMRPPEWEQDPWCPTHPDMPYVIEEHRKALARAESAEAEVVTLRAKVAAVEAHPVVLELAEERTRQTAKHGDQSHLPDGTGAALWLSMDDDYIRRHGIRRDNLAAWAKARTDAASQAHGDGSITFEHVLTEEWAEAIAESDPDALRAELVQVAAVAVQWVEAIDLRAALAGTTGEGE